MADTQPTLDEMWTIIQQQRREIEQFKRRLDGEERPASAATMSVDRDTSLTKRKLTRAGALKVGMLGLAGLAGTEVAATLVAPSAEALNSATASNYFAFQGSGLAYTTGDGSALDYGYTYGVYVPGQTAGVLGLALDSNGNANSGIGVSGMSGSGYGVFGQSSSGNGVGGTSASRNGVQGTCEIWNASGVYGENTSDGYGIYGRCLSRSGGGALGSGTGTTGESGTGAGVNGISTGGYGVHGTSNGNYGLVGNSNSSHGLGGYTTGGYGFVGQSTNGIGARVSNPNGYGAVIDGKIAPIRMLPSTTIIGPPPTTGHLSGELFVDKTSALYYFNGASWKQIA